MRTNNVGFFIDGRPLLDDQLISANLLNERMITLNLCKLADIKKMYKYIDFFTIIREPPFILFFSFMKQLK